MQAPQTPVANASAIRTPSLDTHDHTTPTDFWKAIQQHACFSMWQPAAKIMFQMALDCDPDGAQRFKQMQQAPNSATALGAFHKTQAGRLYRAVSLEQKMQFE